MDSLVHGMAIIGPPLSFIFFAMVLYFEWLDYKAGKRKAQEKALKKARKKEKKRLKQLAST
jgi:hypothetical protein